MIKESIKFFSLAFMAIACSSASSTDNASSGSTWKADSTAVAKLSHSRDSLNLVLKEEHVELEKKISELKKKFHTQKDELSGIEFYTHKTFGKHWPMRKTLTAMTNSNGKSMLESNYFDEDWIFHSRISLKFENGEIAESSDVPTFDKNNRHDNNSDGVYEIVRYLEDSGSLLTKIADNHKGKIYVRFHGREYYDEVWLNQADRNALHDTWQLGEYISRLKLNEMGI